MDAKQKAKLERYFENASRFLWGLSRKNQKNTYPWLRNRGKELWGASFDFQDGSYRKVTEQLLRNPGIERLLKDLIAPIVTRELFTERAIDCLRDCWNDGKLPQLSELKNYSIHDAIHAYPFLEVNAQFGYVERWGDFAGPWFEEIEPWLGKSEAQNGD